MLAGGGAILALVLVLIAAAFLRRRRAARDDLWRRRAARDDRGRERFWIVGLGLGFTMSVLAALLAWGLVIGERLLPRAGSEPAVVHAEARQWSWTFAYEDAPGLLTRDVLHIPAGRPVDVAITSADVIHSFWVPRLAGKLDAIPGHVNVLRIEADKPGRLVGVSAEFSGEGYLGHSFEVIAHDAGDWERFLAGEAR